MSLSVPDLFPEAIEWFDEPVASEVEETITLSQSGRVRALASTWPAKFFSAQSTHTVTAGDTVWVVGRQGITLLVIPVGDRIPPSESHPSETDVAPAPLLPM